MSPLFLVCLSLSLSLTTQKLKKIPKKKKTQQTKHRTEKAFGISQFLQLKKNGFPSRLLRASPSQTTPPHTFSSVLPSEIHFHSLPLFGSPGFPRTRHSMEWWHVRNYRRRFLHLRLLLLSYAPPHSRICSPHPWATARRQILRPRRPTGELRRLFVRLWSGGWDQAADKLSTYIPSELFGPLDGIWSENMSAL